MNPFTKGYQSFIYGEGLKANPYDKAAVVHRQCWIDGWHMAKERFTRVKF